MNRETIMTTLDYYQDDHSAFYYWMAGYLCGTEDASGDDAEVVSSSVEEDKWIVHDGLGRTVPPLVRVRVKIKDGVDAEGYAENFSWVHTGRAIDIIAYRIVDE